MEPEELDMKNGLRMAFDGARRLTAAGAGSPLRGRALAAAGPRKRILYPLAALALLATWAKAPAQNYYQRYYGPQQHVHWHLDGGYAATTGQIADALDGGWTIGGGLSWQPDFTSPLALRADLDYSRFGATNQLIAINQAIDQTQIDDGYGEVVDFSVDGEYKAPLTEYTSVFAVAGIGVAHRRIALTQTVAVGDYFCDPWFGYCDYGLVPGQVVVASDDTTRLEWNAGLGVDFDLRNGQTFFVEARFTRIQTAQPTDFVPIRVGLRF
jgi:opacity protein-like surface antigen